VGSGQEGLEASDLSGECVAPMEGLSGDEEGIGRGFGKFASKGSE
jgi:hypothetical protein